MIFFQSHSDIMDQKNKKKTQAHTKCINSAISENTHTPLTDKRNTHAPLTHKRNTHALGLINAPTHDSRYVCVFS